MRSWVEELFLQHGPGWESIGKSTGCYRSVEMTGLSLIPQLVQLNSNQLFPPYYRGFKIFVRERPTGLGRAVYTLTTNLHRTDDKFELQAID